MGLSFTKPYLLLLLPLLVAFIVFLGKGLKRIPKNKKRLLLILRSIILSLLVLGLCNTSVYWKVDTTTTIFLIDGSASTLTNRTNMEDFIKAAVKTKSPKDKVGVVSFGENAEVESFISKDNLFSKVEGKLNENYTDIENAITTALSLFPDNSNKRIVLLSDGEENTGAVSKISASLSKQDIDFKYFKVEKTIGEEVAVESINLPQKLSLGEEFNLVVTINSTTAEEANINLFNGRNKVSQQKVQLQKGINKFMFKDKADVGGFRSYKVMIEPSKDSQVKNNEATAFTNVVAKPKVLVIEDNKGEADELIKMLKASSIEYTLTAAKAAPRTQQDLTSYKSIIACNVSADNLNDGFLNSLESYVKDFGGGFIATGGDNSFALGGYTKTPLEKVLPVYMDMRGKKEIPKMAMVLIIDKSGSMSEGLAGISKVDMAKEAAIRSLESLRQGKDELGVLTFDGAYSWAVKEQVINDTKAIEADIGTIRADGGTSIIPALQEGYNSLKKSDAKLKHIILLTDGQAEKTGYDALLKDINKDNITVSTVAVGNDADKQLLDTIAAQCGGRAYLTDEYTNIPRIFSKETFMAARNYLNNKEFTPIISSNNNILNGVAENGLPSLLGYIGATQKETAREILKSDEEDPILTVWQYGLGKTAAWNSDISGKWSANYINWNKNLKLWQNLLNFTFENYDNENVSLEVQEHGNKATVVLKDKKDQSQLNSSVVILSPSGISTEEKLSETAPGEYTGTFDLKETGVYMINGKEVKNGEVINSINTGYSVQYSPEYKININSSNLDKLITTIGGRNIKTPDEVFGHDLVNKKGQRDITNFLLALALILFMFDIALRRLNMYKLRERFKKINSLTSTLTESNLSKVKKKQDKTQDSSYEEVPISEPIEKEVNKAEEITAKEVIPDEITETAAKNTLDTTQLLKNRRFKK